ncbi:ABC transporter permease [Olivibacter sitiensis]|uniref:ABC transporter permease n=1 Tax=Olivibacter sitiensis TaxID=376470 RepID=UPI000413A373|nr:ABC transporter permease [Olivibacter sitiensis]
MIKYSFKIVWRTFLKEWKYSAIKIGGFALSIGACLLILLYVLHERGYDKSYPDSDRIYRLVGQSQNNQGENTKGTSFPAPMSKVLEDYFPDIEVQGRLLPSPLFGAGSNQISTEDKPELFYEEGFTFADQAILDMMPQPTAYGNLKDALKNPMSVVITKRKAEKLYPGIDPVGKRLFINGDQSVAITITAVMENIPSNSHLHGLDFFVSLNNMHFYEGEQENWNASNYVIYLKIKPSADISSLQNRMGDLVINDYMIPAAKTAGRPITERMKSAKLILQPIQDIHLNSYDILDYQIFTDNKGDQRVVWLFTATAIFILAIAAINFVNLATARSAAKAREVGMRKIVGSKQSAIVLHFLLESIFYCSLAVLLGILAAVLFLPIFNQLSDKTIAFPWREWWFIPFLGTTSLVIGVLAGVYPAFYLSSFKPATVLKGKTSTGARQPILRRGLVVFQFTISVILIVCTLVIHYQMQFILHRQPGFDKSQIMVLEGTNMLGSQVQAFKSELKRSALVQNVTIGDYLPVHMAAAKRNGNPIWNEGTKQTTDPVQSQFWQVDEDYIGTMGIDLTAGRNFASSMATDSQSVIINEKLANMLNLEQPVGARIVNDWQAFTVIGVVSDFEFESIREGEIGGMALALGHSPHMISVKLKEGDIAQSVEEVKRIWSKFAPNQDMRFSFMDSQFESIYKDVVQTGYIFTGFAGLAIFIACLGLFGLAAYMAELRTKEIGIRKVLGASIPAIVNLLAKGFIMQVFLAVIIASPIAWWAMSKWLQDFAYRIDIEWWMFALAGLAAVAIALATVSWQAIKAALANPVDSLRDE